jgi:putative addiction module killer protein
MFIIQKTEYFDHWLLRLNDIRAKAKILARLKRAELGNLGDHKNIGDGIFEMRIDYGPGYRVYFARSKGIIIILLLGGDKSSQSKDINKAKQIAIDIGV